MTFKETILEGCFVITPSIFTDERGYFMESFNRKAFCDATGEDVIFVQDNQSKSSRGVLRGLHFQEGEFAQAKLVRVIRGSVLDVCVDLRRDSPTFAQSFSIILESKKQQQLYVPRGFAHGFLVLEDNTIFSYKCDNYYKKSSEGGIVYNDSDINIDWGITTSEVILSEKDRVLPTLREYLAS